MPAISSILKTLHNDTALLIAGQTASGKSALAVALAKNLDGVVINADSMQVYADLQILSARPTSEEMDGVPHRLYGHIDAREEYNVGAYLRDLAQILDELKGAGKRAIITGGTGLYFKSMLEGLADMPPIAPEIIAHWNAETARGVNLHAVLASRDAEGAAKLNPADFPRLQRALSVLDATGKPLRYWQQHAQSSALLPAGTWQGFYLNPDRATLMRRIEARFEAMIKAGALQEARHMQSLNLSPNRGIMKAHGLKHLLAHLAGEMPLEEAIREGQADTRHYAKRQMTWARKSMKTWHWLEV